MEKQIMCIFFLVLMIGVFATTIYIPEDYATIQEGINASEDGDEIIVSPGTYIENINFAGKAVILGSLFYTTQDTSYISQTIIDGNQDDSVVTFVSEENSTSVLTGFTITNGQGVGSYPDLTGGGGGITCINSSSPILVNVTIMGNSAEVFGGGIYCGFSSSPSLVNVTITGNSAGLSGGGIYCYSSNLILENVTITGNSAGNGGGISCSSSSPSLENVTITGNSAGNGGGIYCWDESSPSLESVTITGNSAGLSGGGIYCYDESSPSLESVTIKGNSAGNDGGGIYCYSSNLILENVTITDNTADDGGGIYCYSSNLILENVTITDNTADDGGGICCHSSSPSLANVTITGNLAESGGGIYCHSSSPSLDNVTITGNSADDGGGICCWLSSNPSLVNVTIMDNSAEFSGGGIDCHSSNLILEKVTITGNSAYNGGGISCNESSPVFSSDNRCNIYLNNKSNGNEIYSNTNMNVIVDTFTVLNPTDFHAAPIENFTFDILHGLQEQVNADLYVSPSGNNTNSGLTIDDPLKTIQYACSVILADSLNHHTIHLADGIYSPSTNSEFFPVNIPDFISLCGENETGVILNAEGMAEVIKLFYKENVTISDLTITNGNAYKDGGGIYCSSSSPILKNVTITGNSAGSKGGGIYCESSNPSLEDVTITGNSTDAYQGKGGGIYCESSNPSLENVMITGNLAGNGGGIFCHSSSPSLENVTITGNLAGNGGGIYCRSSSPSLENVMIMNNRAVDDGGGIFCDNSSPSLGNVTITGNSAEDKGGGIYCWGSSPSLENVMIMNNWAVDDGGGIFCKASSNPTLVNCIVWNNSPQEVEFASDWDPSTITIAYSDIEGGLDAIVTNNNGTVNWLDGNIDADPLFVDAEMGNYHLIEDSPCIDTGIAYFEYEGEVLVDLSEDEYIGIAPDMGAYE